MLISSHTRDIKSFYHDQTVSITIRAISNHEFFSITSRLTNPKSANLDYFKPGASLFRFTEAQNVEAKPGGVGHGPKGIMGKKSKTAHLHLTFALFTSLVTP